MVIIHRVDPTRNVPDDPGVTPKQWLTYCRERGLVAFAAKVDEELVGLAAAESDAKAVHILSLKGDTDTCSALLDRLVLLAGERDVSGWVPVHRRDVRRFFLRRGFVGVADAEIEGTPSCFYYWCRNDDV